LTFFFPARDFALPFALRSTQQQEWWHQQWQ
jgi:hypothetical protein